MYLSNAYTVFDYSHNQVSLAPLVKEATTPNVTAIDENGVASLSSVAAAGEESDRSGGLSMGAKAGIGIG